MLSDERREQMRYWANGDAFGPYPWVRELLDAYDVLAARLEAAEVLLAETRAAAQVVVDAVGSPRLEPYMDYICRIGNATGALRRILAAQAPGPSTEASE